MQEEGEAHRCGALTACKRLSRVPASGPACGRRAGCRAIPVARRVSGRAGRSAAPLVLLVWSKRRGTALHPACFHAPAGLTSVPSPHEARNDNSGLLVWWHLGSGAGGGSPVGDAAFHLSLRSVTVTVKACTASVYETVQNSPPRLQVQLWGRRHVQLCCEGPTTDTDLIVDAHETPACPLLPPRGAPASRATGQGAGEEQPGTPGRGDSDVRWPCHLLLGMQTPRGPAALSGVRKK